MIQLRGFHAICLACVLLVTATLQAETPQELRDLIIDRVGSLDVLKVPATDADMPQPDDPRFEITPAKKRLGKLLFFDPVRANNIRPEFGGNRAFTQSASCGSCHLGETSSKAGTVVAIGIGGTGRGRFNADSGKFEADRVVMDGLTDSMPTQVEFVDNVGTLTMSGRFDAVDAPFRLAPSVIGFATNTRFFWSGVGGEEYDPSNPNKANVNSNGLPPGENCAEVTFKAHRMFETQRFALQQIPAYVELFRRAFPDEATLSDLSGNLDDLINDDTIGRAIATFMRTVFTRNTPFDQFLDGNDEALSSTQLRGAYLFFQTAAAGGANCVACHSGPALNKVLGDEAGTLVGENFHNMGVNDHPLVSMAQQVLENPDFHDPGRAEATDSDDDLYEFKTPTLRQMRDAGPFMHSGEFATLREVVEYINAGIPAAEFSGNAATISPLFTNPRSEDETGLGLSADDIDALLAFLEDGLYDEAFVEYDPNSTTETFNLNSADLTYGFDLQFLGAQNGRVLSGMAHPQTDEETIADLAASAPVTDICGSLGLFGFVGMAVPMMVMRGRRRRR